MKMYALFTYGTLQDTQIQTQLFGKSLEGTNDTLAKYKLGTIQIPINHPNANTYLIAIYTGNAQDTIDGVRYTINSEKLSLIDDYEGPDYERVLVILQSGEEALVYRKTV